MIELLAFDADDTLWDNEKSYLQAKEQYIQLLSHYGEAEWVERQLDETEIHNIQVYGFGIKSFTLSMIETGLAISESRITGTEIQAIFDIARPMLSAAVDLFGQTEATLARLSQRVDLMLITKGDSFEQEQKVRRSGLSRYFRYVEVVGEKSEQTYRRILEKYRIDPARFLMVGNSLKSDILPVVRIGGQAVLIPYANTWSYEMEVGEGVDHKGYVTLEHLGELPDYFERLAE
jgi:putative hydrolase of the HAD superfamily